MAVANVLSGGGRNEHRWVACFAASSTAALHCTALHCTALRCAGLPPHHGAPRSTLCRRGGVPGRQHPHDHDYHGAGTGSFFTLTGSFYTLRASVRASAQGGESAGQLPLHTRMPLLPYYCSSCTAHCTPHPAGDGHGDDGRAAAHRAPHAHRVLCKGGPPGAGFFVELGL